MDLVFQALQTRLCASIPAPRRAQYIGEAYLMVGNVAKAKEHLSARRQDLLLRLQRVQRSQKAISEAEAKTVKQYRCGRSVLPPCGVRGRSSLGDAQLFRPRVCHPARALSRSPFSENKHQ